MPKRRTKPKSTPVRRFRSTHVISWTPVHGTRRAVRVMLTAEGTAYSRTEWDAFEHADWTWTKHDGWRCLGQPTPNGEAGTVFVRAFPGQRRRERRAGR